MDARPWMVAMAVVLLSLAMAVLALALVLAQHRRCRSRRKSSNAPHSNPRTLRLIHHLSVYHFSTGSIDADASEHMELVTNIILNPQYEGEDEDESTTTTTCNETASVQRSALVKVDV